MRKHRIAIVNTQILKTVVCDVCGQEYEVGKDNFELAECQQIDFIGGTGSVFGEGTRVTIDICQHCMYTKFSACGLRIKGNDKIEV